MKMAFSFSLEDKDQESSTYDRGHDQDPHAAAATTPPKLSLSSFPPLRKLPEPPGMLTPPLHTAASVPFKWEEAPGKPRHSCKPESPGATKVARCLDLPPRLQLYDAAATKTTSGTTMPSPTTVLDGPYTGRTILSKTLSFRKFGGSFRSPESWSGRDIKERVSFGSSRWGTYGHSLVKTRHRDDDHHEVGEEVGGSEILLPLFFGGGGESETESETTMRTTVKMTRLSMRKRRKSFFAPSQTKSHFWASIYGGFKQMVPWRRRQQQQP